MHNEGVPDYNSIFTSFAGVSPLHIAIRANDYECVRLLLEETNLDHKVLTDKNESPIHLSCKHSVDIEILERLLVSLRNDLSTEDVKEYLSLKDQGGLAPIEYAKLRKRADLCVILDEFADFNKQVIDIEFEYLD